MSWKTLVILAVIAVGLGGFLVVDNYWLIPKREKVEGAKGRLWKVEPKDVETVTIKRKGETIRLKRSADGWDMLEPVKARGDRGAVDEVVTSLATLRADREIDPNPAKLSDFGLEPPAAEVTLEVKDGKAPLTLAVGGKNPTGVWVYAREGSKPAVVALGESVFRDTARPVSDFRDKTVLAFDRKNVTTVDLDLEGSKMTLEALEGGKWKIARPGPYPADADVVAEALDKLAAAKVREFVGQPSSLGPYGLDKPSSITIWLGKDKDRTSKTLLFGKVDKAKKGVYVVRQGEPEVLLTGEEVWDKLPRTVAAARDKIVFAYAYDKVSRVELDHGRGKVTLERDGISWKITAPESLTADTSVVNALLWRLRDLRASGFLDESASGIPRYLGKPAVTVRLWEEGAKEPRTFLLALSKDLKAGESTGVAATAGQGPVVMVESKAVTDLEKTSADLRDKTVVASFDMKEVKRVRVVAGDKRLVVEKRGEDAWRIVEGGKGSAKEFKVTSLLLALRALRWKDIAAPDASQAQKFGLDKPEVEVTVLKGDGSEMAKLAIGRTEDKVAYVQSKSAPGVYVVDTTALDDIRKAPTDIPG
ncbi:MAG TPA: DUF4340 domain-containing protein [Methylomirabilota bacterium]|nr:DUF4340 domain-containing protein [Methylomirabilota bacterium]